MKTRFLVPVLLAALAFGACEDDPILTPQAVKGAGGSYSRINPPAVPDSSRTVRPERGIVNPKTF
jgi:hypothetical protein